MNRDELRKRFAEKGFDYSKIGKKQIKSLCEHLNKELAVFDNNGFTMKVRAFRLNDVEYDLNGTVKKCHIMVSGRINNEFFHFKRREAISFNSRNKEGDVFIGFCGWADDTNSKPFLNAFDKWITLNFI